MNETRTFAVTISGAQLVVSCVSGSVLQLKIWNQLWGLLLGGISAVPAASGTDA
jgi:hypothetical protein